MLLLNLSAHLSLRVTARRSQGGRYSNGIAVFPISRTIFDVGICRKLKDAHQGLPPPGAGLVELLTNAENAQKINGLMEDIREALIDYQVCMSSCSFPPCLTFLLDFTATRYL